MSNEALIFAIKLTHTLVFIFVSACILYVLRCGIVGRRSRRLLLPAFWIPTLVGLLWLVNGDECIMATVMYSLSGDRSEPDLFLPTWFSRWIMPGSTLIMTIGACLVLWRRFAHKWAGDKGPENASP